MPDLTPDDIEKATAALNAMETLLALGERVPRENQWRAVELLRPPMEALPSLLAEVASLRSRAESAEAALADARRALEGVLARFDGSGFEKAHCNVSGMGRHHYRHGTVPESYVEELRALLAPREVKP